MRRFCTAHGLTYQGFSLLTANRAALDHSGLIRIAKRHDHTAAQIVFRFALEVGMLPLTGTRDPAHMRADLDSVDFQLTQEEVASIDRILMD